MVQLLIESCDFISFTIGMVVAERYISVVGTDIYIIDTYSKTKMMDNYCVVYKLDEPLQQLIVKLHTEKNIFYIKTNIKDY